MNIFFAFVNFLATIAIGLSILHRTYHVAATNFSGMAFMYLLQILNK